MFLYVTPINSLAHTAPLEWNHYFGLLLDALKGEKAYALISPGKVTGQISILLMKQGFISIARVWGLVHMCFGADL